MKYNEFNKKVYLEIPPNARILDMGCDTGELGKMIKKEKDPIEVIGIDINQKAAALAKKYYDHVYIDDAQTMNLDVFENNYFDCIILADVLEHLQNPDKLLLKIRPKLRDDGKLIISVPNVVFVTNRFNIVFGRFNYSYKGIMDTSHLRFYTSASIQKLISNCNYKVSKVQGYISTRPLLGFLDYFAKIIPSLFAYQILVVATKR